MTSDLVGATIVGPSFCEEIVVRSLYVFVQRTEEDRHQMAFHSTFRIFGKLTILLESISKVSIMKGMFVFLRSFVRKGKVILNEGPACSNFKIREIGITEDTTGETTRRNAVDEREHMWILSGDFSRRHLTGPKHVFMYRIRIVFRFH